MVTAYNSSHIVFFGANLYLTVTPVTVIRVADIYAFSLQFLVSMIYGNFSLYAIITSQLASNIPSFML